jgi:hypothetical protein
VFTGHCNRIGKSLGLDDVVVRNRGGAKLPKSAQWPHCVAPPGRYLGAYRPRSSAVTARAVTIPAGHTPVFIGPKIVGGQAVLSIELVPANGDGPTVQLNTDIDTAAELADLITEYLSADDEDGADE